MSTNKVNNEGAVIEYSNTGSAISSGDVVQTGDLVGIAATDIAATTGVGSVEIEGVFTVAKVTGVAWIQGDKVDWDASNSAFGKGITTASGDVTNCGIAFKAAASGDATAQVKLTPGTGTEI